MATRKVTESQLVVESSSPFFAAATTTTTNSFSNPSPRPPLPSHTMPLVTFALVQEE